PHSLSRSHGDRRDLHSFPTRRSSDLPTLRERDPPPARVRGGAAAGERERVRGRARGGVGPHLRAAAVGGGELMALVSHATREITCKIVYYGPGRSGKTTNLQHVHATTPAARRGQMVSLATDTDRTLFFDFLPLDLGSISGYRT